MVTRVAVSPDLLTWAVGRAGWDDETAHRRAPKLADWLSGSKPTIKQLEKFAHDTHTPFGLLFLDQPPVESSPIPDMRTLRNESIRQPSADLLDTIYLCERRQAWYRAHLQNQDTEPLEFVGSASVASSPLLTASEVRDALGFDVGERSNFANWEDALRRLIDRIEAIGVLVMVNGVVGSNTHRKLRPDEFRGFALADAIAPLVFVNGSDTKAAQIFTLIHELGHIWLGESALSEAAMTARRGEDAELWCNQLAAEVLAPISMVRQEYRGAPEVAELERLARRFRVSTLVVLKRIYDADFIDWNDYQHRYAEELRRVMEIVEERRNPAGGGNYYYTQPLRLSRLFARAVVASTQEGTTAYRDAYHLLGTKKHEAFENLAAELGVG